jgi:hypothetical protein
VRVYGDEGLALRIGDAETFEEVDYGAWMDWCEDCGFGFPAVRKALLKMASQLLPSWEKVKAELLQGTQPTTPEVQLLQRMETTFNQHVGWVNRKVGLS